MTHKTIGVLGGMGPWATLDFFEKILRLTPAKTDQEHLRVIIDNNPKIPDRSPAIVGTGEDPTPALVAGARTLQQAGADVIVIPCNTAHYFYERVQNAVSIPVLHIMEEVAATAREEVPTARVLGILATTAAISSGLYARACARRGIEVVNPDPSGQQVVNRAIYGVKGGQMGPEITAGLKKIADGLVGRGAQALVLGCTELPFVLKPQDVRVPLLDSNQILARAAVRFATGVPLPTPT
ncbi:MAG TPA: amino acid racemase [bacterium]|nr:amino acid racemase [bacterium]